MFVSERIRIDPAYRERLSASRLDTVARVLSLTDGVIMAWSRTTDTLYVPGEGDTPGYYVKRHFFPTWGKRWRGALRGTFFAAHRGQREYRALNAMRAAGVPAVRAVAYGERRVGHFLAACFLMTEEVPGAVNLTTFAQAVQDGRRELSPAQRQEMIRELARALSEMHAHGVSHNNLFWRNILVRPGPDGRAEFFLLDPQPLRAWERMGPRGAWRQPELAQLAVSARLFSSRSDRLRFFKAYLGESRLAASARSWAGEVEQVSPHDRAHEQRRVRLNGLFAKWNAQLVAEQRCWGESGLARPTREAGA
jgi:hypothetical protein